MKRKSSGPSPPSGCWRRLTSAASRGEELGATSRQPPTFDPVGQDARRPGRAHRSGDDLRACRRARRTWLPIADRRRPAGANWAARLTRRRADDAERGLVVLADDQEVVAPLAAEEGRGRVLDGDRVAQPGLGRARGRRARSAASSSGAEQGVARQVGRGVALEDDRRARQDGLALAGPGRGAARGRPRASRRRARRPGRSGCPRARRWRRCRSPRRAARATWRPGCSRPGSGASRPRCTEARSARPSGRGCSAPG